MSWFISPLTGVLTHTYELVNELLPSAKWLITNTLQAFPRPPISECPDVENPPSWRCPLCVFGSLPLDEDSFMVQPYKPNKNLENCPKKLKRKLLKESTTLTHIYTCFLSIRETLFGTLRHHFLFATKKKKKRETHRWGTSHASWLEGTSSESNCTCILSRFLRRKAGGSGTRLFSGGLKRW